MISLRDLLDNDLPSSKTAAHALIALYSQIDQEQADPQLFALVAWLKVRHPLTAPQTEAE
jgi:nicotinic acid phosphoribosyltransferase